MVLDGATATANYRDGINAIGGSAKYFECGKAGTIRGVAECLKGAKQGAGLDKWAAKYQKRYG